MQNKKIKILLKSIILWILVPAVLTGAATWYLMGKIWAEEKNVDEANLNYTTTVDQLNSFDKVKREYNSIKDQKGELENMIVTKDNTLDLIKELEKAAETTNVKLVTNITDNPLKKKVIQKTPVSPDKNSASNDVWLKLEVDGKFENILRFVHYLENANKIVNIYNVNISQSQLMTPDIIFSDDPGDLGNLHVIIIITNNF